MGEIVVGAIIENSEGKFLLVQEGKQQCRGKWNIPSGHLEPNESLIDAIIREVKEETGCIIKPTGVLQIGNMVKNDDAFVAVIFLCDLVKNASIIDHNEILNMGWFSFEEIVEMKDQLRIYRWVVDSLKSYKNKEICDLSMVNILKQ